MSKLHLVTHSTTAALFAELTSNLYGADIATRSAVVIVPNDAVRDAAQREWLRSKVAQDSRTDLPDILTLSELRENYQMGAKLSSLEAMRIWLELLEQQPGSDPLRMLGSLMRLNRTLNDYWIDVADLRSPLFGIPPESMWVVDIVQKFRELAKDHRDLDLPRLSSWAEERRIYFFGFSQISIRDRSIIRTLIQSGKTPIFYVLSDPPPQQLYQKMKAWLAAFEDVENQAILPQPNLPLIPELRSFESIASECQWLARQVLSLWHQGSSLADLCIVVPSFDAYFSEISSAFSEFGLTIFRAQVPLRESATYPFFKYLFRLTAGPFYVADVLGFLTAPYVSMVTGADGEATLVRPDFIQQLFRFLGLADHVLDFSEWDAGFLKYREQLLAQEMAGAHHDEECDLLSKQVAILSRLFAYVEEMRKVTTLSELLSCITNVSRWFNLPAQAHLEFLYDFSQVQQLIQDAALAYRSKNVSQKGIEPVLDTPRFFTHLPWILEESSLIPMRTRESGVRVMTPHMASGCVYPIVIIAGLSATQWHFPPDSALFLPSAIQNYLSGNPDSVYEAAPFFFEALCGQATQGLFLSYPRRIQQQQLIPFHRLSGLQITDSDSISQLPYSRAQVHRLGYALDLGRMRPVNRGDQNREVLRPIALQMWQKKIRHLSVSSLDQYQRCPYAFFLDRVLQTPSLDEVGANRFSQDWGSFLHAVFRRFYLGLGGKNLSLFSHSEARDRLFQSFTMLAKIYQNPHPQWLFHLQKWLGQPALLDQFLETDYHSYANWTPAHIEESFEIPILHASDQKMAITGKWDLVLREPGAAVATGNHIVVDYKTASSLPTQKSLSELNALQIPLYLLALHQRLNLNGVAGGILYQVRDHHAFNKRLVARSASVPPDIFHSKQSRPLVFTPSYFEEIENKAVALAQDIYAGKFSAYDQLTDPKTRRQQCVRCQYRPLCRYPEAAE